MIERDENGKFAKGNAGGPGRPKREREVEYYHVLQTRCTPRDWSRIVQKAVDQAVHGDAIARKWLADYLIGPPVERKEISGVDGDSLQIEVIYKKADLPE